jgi:beta-galactosidase
MDHVIAETRTITSLDMDWRFHLDDAEDFQVIRLDDSSWRQLNVPHDWSIEGPFNQNASTGGGGAIFPRVLAGTASIFASERGNGQRVWIEFDGVYENSTVWVNGKRLDPTFWLH